MDIQFKTSCRAAGKHYILSKVSNAPAGSHIEVACATCTDPTFPKFLKIGLRGDDASLESRACDVDGEYVLVLPQADGGVQTVEFFAIDAAGERSAAVARKVSEFEYKWRSRLNYKFHPAGVARIRNFDGYEAGLGAWFYIDDIIPDGKEGIYRGICRLPQDTAGEVSVECIDARGKRWRNAIMLKDGVRTSPRDESTRYRELEFSIRLPLKPRYLEFVAVRDAEDLVGTKVLDGKEIAAMLQNSQKYVVTAQNDPTYGKWLAAHRASADELTSQRLANFAYEPIFSIVVPLYKTRPAHFKAMVESVAAQTYPYWQLVLVNASPEDKTLSREARTAAEGESRITLVDVGQNGGISANTNVGIDAAAGDFVCFLDHDDTLEPDCLYEYARVLNNDSKCDVIYCDEDNLRTDGTYASPFFKAPFSPAQLEARNYICHFLAVRKSVIDEVGSLNPEYDGAQDYDLVLRATEAARSVVHVPRVLYHWRQSRSSTAADINAKPYAKTAGVRALQAHLDRLGVAAKATDGAFPTWYTLDYSDSFAQGGRQGNTGEGVSVQDADPSLGDAALAMRRIEPPLVSVIIPNKDAADFLEDCVESVYALGGYSNLEVIVVENNSTEEATFAMYEKLKAAHSSLRVTVWRGAYAGEFNFSAIVNAGVREAHGELLLLLNNDTRAITPGWIAQLAGGALRKGVGIVGAKLYYADDTIQHAGVSITNECARHINLSLPRTAEGYYGSAIVSQNLSAVTAACMMVTRDAYEQAGGFDEGLAVAFNDVDFCLKVRDVGLAVVLDVSVELYHFESVSRGYEDTEAKMRRFGREIKRMRNRWHTYYEDGDPYINPNFIGEEGFNQYYGLPKSDRI